ncbi:hypothetical protein ASESINO_129 [Erwinia phage vB_EamM_Asesino]|uniref:Uncharacterized protein n=1 Tax=Erwinia phage vB_EamM_Asesino TaxID=1883370 RepID=A0A1B2IA64_9CAUD|nr:hypothetical protein ASESINO_129 [Erwinia phage vB_EamM_Asesino]ANZ48142.1 hypothetical protein ASESINO_129 [Erwinia phage vB_EamM_Asesino]
MKTRYGGISLRDLKAFKQRTFEALEKSWIEPGIRETCRMINKHPGATTVWACQGHGPYSKRNAPGECHVVFAVAAGYEHLVDEFMAELMNSDLAPLWNLSLARLLYPDDPFIMMEDMTLKNTYSAWKIHYGFMHTEPTLREVRKVFLAAATKVFKSK